MNIIEEPDADSDELKMLKYLSFLTGADSEKEALKFVAKIPRKYANTLLANLLIKFEQNHKEMIAKYYKLTSQLKSISLDVSYLDTIKENKKGYKDLRQSKKALSNQELFKSVG